MLLTRKRWVRAREFTRAGGAKRVYGFYYDFARDAPFTPADLEAMEARMRETIARNELITREVWDRDNAVRYFESIGEAYETEIIRDLPEGDEITIYRQGAFVDPCRGPHLPPPASSAPPSSSPGSPVPTDGAIRGTRCSSASTALPSGTRK